MTETAGAENTHKKYKIVFLGDQSVGKTSVILQFTQSNFDNNYTVSLLLVIICSGYYRNRLFE